MEFNSLTGEIFVAENEARRIVSVDTINKNTFDLVKDHIFSVKSMGFGKLRKLCKTFKFRQLFFLFFFPPLQIILPTIFIGPIT
jgi:hypothetical protein